MAKAYRITFEGYDSERPDVTSERHIIKSGTLDCPTSNLDFSLSHMEQIELLGSCLTHILTGKAKALNCKHGEPCPECGGKMKKGGKRHSQFNDIFTEHEITIQRLRCVECGYEPPSTTLGLFNTTQSGELMRLQAEIGAQETYRSAEDIFTSFCGAKRRTNNHNRIKEVSRNMGDATIKLVKEEKELLSAKPASEIIMNVDGGHVKTIENKRSIEALAVVLYRPEALVSNSTGTRNTLTSKHCAASAKNDDQSDIISKTMVAAMKEGLTNETAITALCDGAQNCWNVIEAIRPFAKSLTCILDWFHITMKMQNISLPKIEKDKFLRVKWHLWRGNVDNALRRLNELMLLAGADLSKDKLKKFAHYIENNRDRIINYRERKKQGLVFTSNLAECTVESLINQRCKRQQHMRWSRDGLDPILQLRSVINTPEWDNYWKSAVREAIA